MSDELLDGVPARRPRRRHRLLKCAALLLVLVVGVAAGGLLYLQAKVAGIPRVAVSQVLNGGKQEPSTTQATVDPSTSAAPSAAAGVTSTVAGPAAEPSKAINVLLVGVDSADGLAPDDPVRTQREAQGVGTNPRPDSVLLARIDPTKNRISLVSLPRDLWVTVNEAGRHDRLNAAMADGGAAQLITTVTTNLAVPVDHYVQVDFEQFKELVAVLGGVTVPVERPLRDTHSGLYLLDPGCVELSPAQALAYARSRYMEFKDDSGAWVSDPTSDLGRMSRQQDFLVAALKGAQSAARNPLTLNRLLDRATKSVVLDDSFGVGELASLAYRFRSYDPARTERYRLPVAPATIDGKDVLQLRPVSAQPVLDVFRGIEPAPVAPADVTVTLHDGGAGADSVEQVRAGLENRGFGVVVGGSTPGATTLTFPLVHRAAAELLARNLTMPVQFALDDDSTSAVTLVVGSDFGGLSGGAGAVAEPSGVSSRPVGATAGTTLAC